MAVSPIFSSALMSAIEEFMTGKYGRPYTLVEIITWLFNQLVEPNHPIGRVFEATVREEPEHEEAFLDLLKEPRKLKRELEDLLSPGIINYSTAIEQILLGQMGWNQVPLEFMMVWELGKNRWTVEKATPVETGDTKRVAFIARNPRGERYLFVSASGVADAEAEQQGMRAYNTFTRDFGDDIPRFVVTLSNQNKENFKQGMPGFIRLHYFSNFLISHS